MYPTLYHAIKDLIGLEIPFLKLLNSFGFFVVLAFIAAAYTLSLEMKRLTDTGIMKPVFQDVKRGHKPSIGSYFISALMGFVLGFKFLYVMLNGDQALTDPPAFLFSTKGSLMGGLAIAALFAWLRFREWKAEQKKHPEPTSVRHQISPREHANSLAVKAAIWGFIGAKLFFIFEDPNAIKSFFTEFSANSILSGLTIYGGLIMGTIGVFRYFKKNGIPPLAGVDAVAPGFLLAYGIGRIGCQVSGDGDWGIANPKPKPDWMSFLPDWMWSYNYPNNVNKVIGPNDKGGYIGKPMTADMPQEIFEGYGTYLEPGVWPTPIYETLMAVGLFFILWALRKRLKPLGAIFFLTFAFNGIERWFIEKVRVNDPIPFLGFSLTQAEWISILITMVGIGGLIWVYRNHKPEHVVS